MISELFLAGEKELVACLMPFLLNFMQAHVYSLGATLKAAIEYIVEPETESEFGQDLHTLLEQMQEENPENRPDIEVKEPYIIFCFKKVTKIFLYVCSLIERWSLYVICSDFARKLRFSQTQQKFFFLSTLMEIQPEKQM